MSIEMQLKLLALPLFHRCPISVALMNLAQETAIAQGRSRNILFVTLQYVELLDIILNKFESSDPFKFSDIDPNVCLNLKSGGEQCIYEMLSSEK